MTIFFLPEQHPLTLESLPDGRFYTKDWSLSIVKVPHGCAPVLCEYTGDRKNKNHSWTNPISGNFYETKPLGLTETDDSLYQGFYEITRIEGLTFGEGEAWCHDTNQKIHVEKTDHRSIWNPFFQRYDPPCNRNEHDCDPLNRKIKYVVTHESVHEIFEEDIDLFTKVYCPCCICKSCHKIHVWDCVGHSSHTSEL